VYLFSGSYIIIIKVNKIRDMAIKSLKEQGINLTGVK
jgi:hypothetical protein